MRLAASLAGLSAESIASILAVGLVLGTFPIFGCPMVLCALASLVLGLNFPALQLINQLSWPLQIAMLIPCVRLGARIFDFPHGWATSVTSRLGASALQAVTGWFCICVPLGILLYFTLAAALRRWVKPRGAGCQTAADCQSAWWSNHIADRLQHASDGAGWKIHDLVTGGLSHRHQPNIQREL